MSKKREAHLFLKFCTSDGFTSEQRGPSTDEELFAISMITCFADHREPVEGDSPTVAQFRRAVASFMEAAAAYKEHFQKERRERATPTG